MKTDHRRQIYLAASFLLALLLIISRRPDVLTRAQFFAEDGPAWYAQAYSLGPWHALSMPFAGYLQVLPRLAAGCALLVPLRDAPLVMNAIGLLLQALPVPILLSRRLEGWASFPLRLLLAVSYVALPNVAELMASVTQGHWHLALAGCLIVLAAPPATRWQASGDIALLVLCGLSGPFVLPLSLVALAYWWLRRGKWRAWSASLLVSLAMVQTGCLVFSHTRPRGTLGPSFPLLLQILAAQIYEGALVGRNSMHRSHVLVQIAVVLLGSSFIAYCFVKSKVEWKLLLLFCTAVFAGSLASPNAGNGISQWATMAGTWDNRYWLFGIVAFVWCLSWCSIRSPAKFWRFASIVLLTVLVVYLPKTWRTKPADDVGFERAARHFETAPPGEVVTIPILPAGWTMELRKR